MGIIWIDQLTLSECCSQHHFNRLYIPKYFLVPISGWIKLGTQTNYKNFILWSVLRHKNVLSVSSSSLPLSVLEELQQTPKMATSKHVSLFLSKRLNIYKRSDHLWDTDFISAWPNIMSRRVEWVKLKEKSQLHITLNVLLIAERVNSPRMTDHDLGQYFQMFIIGCQYSWHLPIVYFILFLL